MATGPGALKGFTGGTARGGHVDYRFARRILVTEYRKGRLGREQVCDGQKELVRNAVHCGEPTQVACPICEDAKLVLVTYVFGPRLPASGRCISRKGELRELNRAAGPFTAYVVEVCTECAWNHLVQSFPIGRPRA